MNKIEVRKAKYKDIRAIAGLIYFTEVHPQEVWGGESREECLDNLSELIGLSGSRYSYKYIRVAEKNNEIMGAMITIPYDKLDSLSLKTNMKTVKYYNGAIEKIKFVLSRITYMLFKECKSGNLYIANIATSKSARGLGIGKLLMAYAEKEAKLYRYNGISLLAKDENVSKFYEKLNYRINLDKVLFGERIIRMAKFV